MALARFWRRRMKDPLKVTVHSRHPPCRVSYPADAVHVLGGRGGILRGISMAYGVTRRVRSIAGARWRLRTQAIAAPAPPRRGGSAAPQHHSLRLNNTMAVAPPCGDGPEPRGLRSGPDLHHRQASRSPPA